jgi:hypothetical protein
MSMLLLCCTAWKRLPEHSMTCIAMRATHILVVWVAASTRAEVKQLFAYASIQQELQQQIKNCMTCTL